MMAECLNAINWAEGPLYVEVPYKSDDIIVEDSDIEESPSTKAARNRRREAIGRRYLLGHAPLIQTALLKGPFGSKDGWVTPWGRATVCAQDGEPKRITSNQTKAVTTQEVIPTEYENLGIESISKATIGEDPVPYDADNEDDAFDEINDIENSLPFDAESLHNNVGEYAYLFQDKSYPENIDYETSYNSENDFRRLPKYYDNKKRGRAEHAFIQGDRKRKRGVGWLKGANVLKRSRYEVLEYSSPTPAAGVVQPGDICIQIETSFSKSDLETPSRKVCSPIVVALNTGSPTNEVGIKDDSAAVWAASDCQKNISLFEEEATKNLPIQQWQNDAPLIEDLTQQQLVLTESTEEQRLDLLEPSSMDLQVDRLESSSSVPRILPQKVGSIALQFLDQVVDEQGHGDLAISGIPADNNMTESLLDHQTNFNDLCSLASEGSFHYRKTNRKSQEQIFSPNAPKGQGLNDIEDGKGVEGNGDLTGRDTPRFESLFASAHHSGNRTRSEIAKGRDLRTHSTIRRHKKSKRKQNLRNSPETTLDALNELRRASSPDPLCEEFRHGGKEYVAINSQGSGRNQAGSFQDDVFRGELQRTMATQVDSDSLRDITGPQAFGFRTSTDGSVPSVSDDHMEQSPSPSLSAQRQSIRSHTKKANLLAKADGLDEMPLALTSPISGRLTSPQESPTVDHTLKGFSQNLQPSDMVSTRQIIFKGNVESTRPADCGPQIESTSVGSPDQLAPELSTSIQSPWTAEIPKSSSPALLVSCGSHSSASNREHGTSKCDLEHGPLDTKNLGMLFQKVDESCSTDANKRAERESPGLSRSLWINAGQSIHELGQSPARFPSIQTLVDATTINPWHSALKKKPSMRKSEKRVSFGLIPAEDIDNPVNGAFSKAVERMGSPPPPAGALRLTQLDDPFHYRLKATRDLEVTEESLTKFMNTPWDKIPPLTPRAKPLLSSPTVVAMADAFITADQQTHFNKVNKQTASHDATSSPLPTKLTRSLVQPPILTASEAQEFKSSSPPDASFTIAPSGKVTAVSIESIGYDAEENFDAVIEEMGGFLAGWDVESELKKVKGHKSERWSNINSPRKRECLSGVSNR